VIFSCQHYLFNKNPFKSKKQIYEVAYESEFVHDRGPLSIRPLVLAALFHTLHPSDLGLPAMHCAQAVAVFVVGNGRKHHFNSALAHLGSLWDLLDLNRQPNRRGHVVEATPGFGPCGESCDQKHLKDGYWDLHMRQSKVRMHNSVGVRVKVEGNFLEGFHRREFLGHGVDRPLCKGKVPRYDVHAIDHIQARGSVRLCRHVAIQAH